MIYVIQQYNTENLISHYVRPTGFWSNMIKKPEKNVVTVHIHNVMYTHLIDTGVYCYQP